MLDSPSAAAPSPPGWLDFERIRPRIWWDATAPSGTPQLRIRRWARNEGAKGNVFTRQEDWFHKCYNRTEQARILHRSQLQPGEANSLLQRLRAGEREAAHLNIKEDLADEDIVALESAPLEPSAFPNPAVDGEEDNKEHLPLICQRCHDLRQNEYRVPDLRLEPESPLLVLGERERDIIHAEMMSRSVLVIVADLLDVPWSFPYSSFELLRPLMRQGEEFPGIFLVGNKMDLMPKHMQDIREYFEALFLEKLAPSLRAKFIGSHLISAKSGRGIAELGQVLLHLARERDGNLFLLGRTNVGKSLLYNKLVKRDHATATVSKVAGTTIGVVRSRLRALQRSSHPSADAIPVNRFIFDLPGIIDAAGSLTNLLTAEEHDRVQVSTQIRPDRRMLKTGETGLFGGLIRISCLGDNPDLQVRLKCYMRADWHYLRASRSENIEMLLSKGLNERPHTLPLLHASRHDGRWDVFSSPMLACRLDVIGKEPREMVFSDGIGWISAHLANPDDRVSLLVYTPLGVGVLERPPLATYIRDKVA